MKPELAEADSIAHVHPVDIHDVDIHNVDIHNVDVGEEPAFVPPAGFATASIWLVRHGETTWSMSGRHTGRTDIPLTAFGEQQARALRGHLASLRPGLVLSSPRRRARHTAELAGLTVDAIDDDLAEWDYGELEGLTTPEIRREYPRWTIWTGPVPGGENAAQVTRRADRLLARAVAATGPVVLFTHGHLGRVLGARWVGLPATGGGRLALGTASVSVLGTEHGEAVIDRWNLPNPAVSVGSGSIISEPSPIQEAT